MSRVRANGEGSIYKFRNGWRAHVWVESPDGTRRRKFVQDEDRKACHEKWLKLQAEAAKGPINTKRITVEMWLKQWLEEVVKPNLAPGTYNDYERNVRLYINPALGKKRIEKLTPSDVRKWLIDLKGRCQCCAQGKDVARGAKARCCARVPEPECCQQILGEWAVHQAWRTIRTSLGIALGDELIPRNVATHAKVKTPRKTRAQIWSTAEAITFLTHARNTADAYYAAYVVLLTLGLRRGEVLGIHWEDIDWEKGILNITWQIQRINGKLIRRPVKTDGSGVPLPIPEVCLVALKDRRAQQQQWEKMAGDAWHDSGLVFTTRTGEALDPRNFFRAFINRGKTAGVPRIPIHSTRRTCASLLVELVVHPRVIMAILRHSKIAITMEIYAQVPNSETTAALTALSKSLEGEQPPT